jgi:hypothetical protein
MANRKHSWSVLIAAATAVANIAAFSQERIEPKPEDSIVERALKSSKALKEGIDVEPRGMLATADQISPYFQGAEPAIVDELSKSGANVQGEQINSVLKSRIAATFTEKARSDPSISFEALTGELTIRGSRNLTGGEVNVYKVSLVLTGLILACREEGKTVKECVHEAFKAAEMEIVGLMKFGDSSNKN